MVAKKISKKRVGKIKRVSSKKRTQKITPKNIFTEPIEDEAIENEHELENINEKSESQIDTLEDDESDEQKDVDEKGPKMIVLSTINDISEVGKLHDSWQEHLSGPIMVIEASAVEKMDTSVLQLLCALIKDTDENGVDVEWKNPSEKLKHVVKLLGLNGPLKLH